MDSKIIHAACMGAVVIVIATGVVIIEKETNRNYIPKESCINAIVQREFYMDSIYRGDRHYAEQICMKLAVLYNCVIVSQFMTYYDQLKMYLLRSKYLCSYKL